MTTPHETLETDAREAGYGVQYDTAETVITKDVGVANVNQVRVARNPDGSFTSAKEVDPGGAVVNTFTSMKSVRDHLDL
jgi:hypothetical protein